MSSERPDISKFSIQFGLLHLLILVFCIGAALWVGRYIGNRDLGRVVEDLQRNHQQNMERLHWYGEDFASIKLRLQEHVFEITKSGFAKEHPRSLLPDFRRAKDFLIRARQLNLHPPDASCETFLDTCLKSFDSFNSPANAWRAFIAEPDQNLLPLYWYAMRDRSLSDYLLSELKNPNGANLAEMSGFLSWYFTFLSNDQRKDLLETLFTIEINTHPSEKLRPQRRDAKPEFYSLNPLLKISYPVKFHDANRNFSLRIGQGSCIKIDGSEYPVQCSIGSDRTYSPTTLGDFKPGRHSCRIILDGYYQAAENLGRTQDYAYHKIPFHLESAEFEIEVSDMPQGN
jgi:hypothetical protein